MKVLKFGGASVQDAAAVKNVGEILKDYGRNNPVIIISAMGKTTNALEDLLNTWWAKGDHMVALKKVKDFHYRIVDELFNSDKSEEIYNYLESYFLSLELYFARNPEGDYDFIYDEIVSYGELISTRIVSEYLDKSGYPNKWVDARNFIITDGLNREARIDWEMTPALIKHKIPHLLRYGPIITQGFIGGTRDNKTTTLGREGSDFTASIFAYSLDAEEVMIWKDVSGILNADPKKFPDTIKFDTLSYQEAIEMTYYGARVLHPKTIRPIRNKNIPMNVRSFVHPHAEGTIISNFPVRTDIPIIILKERQMMISFSTRDYSFMAEENIRKIFEEVVRHGISVNVMNNSAISFVICVDEMGKKIDDFIKALEADFEINAFERLSLLSIRHYNDKTVMELLKGKEIALEQRGIDTVQFVFKA